MHLLQNLSSPPRCAFKANSSSPLEIQFIPGEPSNVRAEMEKSDITLCVGSSMDGNVEECAGDFKDIKKTHFSQQDPRPATQNFWYLEQGVLSHPRSCS